MSEQTSFLLDGFDKCGPVICHTLSDLGDGSMLAGVENILLEGIDLGVDAALEVGIDAGYALRVAEEIAFAKKAAFGGLCVVGSILAIKCVSAARRALYGNKKNPKIVKDALAAI